MRLIDADKLKKKIIHWNYNATTTAPPINFVTDEDIDDMPTVCDIEQIRAEIEEAKLKERYVATMDGLSIALGIIDKHTEGR